MGMSRYLTRESLRYYLTAEPATPRPTTWELSLHSDDPGVDGTNNEIDDTAYARQAIAFEELDNAWGEPYAQNDGEVAFPPADGPYTATHLVVWGDNEALIVQALRTPRIIGATEQAIVATGEIRIGAPQ